MVSRYEQLIGQGEEELYEKFADLLADAIIKPNTLIRQDLRNFAVVKHILQTNPSIFPFYMFEELLAHMQKELPFQHFGDTLRSHTRPIPEGGTLLFLGSRHGEELLEARRAYPGATLVGVEKTPSAMTAYTAQKTKSDMYIADITTYQPSSKLHTLTEVVPDVTVIRHPNPQDPFWQYVIPQLAESAGKAGKQVLMTNYHEDEASRLLALCTFLGVAQKTTVDHTRPKTQVPGVTKDNRADKVVTVFG
jgi:hypothetical protein